MALGLSYLIFGFAVITFVMAWKVLRTHSQKRGEHYLFYFFCMGSTIWSFGFGLLISQTSPQKAYYLRCFGMIGMFMYMMFATLLLAQWSGITNHAIKLVKYFPLVGIVLYPVTIQRSIILFHLSKYGMSYTFAPGMASNLYSLYCLITAAGMAYLGLRMCFDKRRKAIRVFGKKLILCEFVILFGMIFDTILPMFGMGAFPGSTITQFLGVLLMYQAYFFYQRNCVTLNNMSEFVYYSVETPVLIYDEQVHLKIANRNAIEFLQIPEDFEQVALSDMFEVDKNVLDIQTARIKFDVHCKVNDAYCRLVINKIFDQYREVLGYIIIVDDLTDQMKVIKELQEARQHADMANRAKTSFLTKMSHEIRTPLNTVLGMDEMILRETTSDKVAEYAEYIRSSGTVLLGLINDILDLSKLESGRNRLIENDYCLADVLRDILNIVALKRKEKGLELCLDIAKDVPAWLYGDELRVKQIVTNVMNNAVKYTEKGAISLKVHWKPMDEETIELCIQVADTGRGIRKEDMDRLFAPFERLDEKETRMIEGTGLGLAITKDLVEMMGGKMEVESEYGKGSVFSIVFPQKVAMWLPIGTFQQSKEMAEPKRHKREKNVGRLEAPDVRILVVDDTPSNLMIIQGLLKRTKIKVDLAKSGRDALRMIDKKQYQIIFLDHMMPEMDGIETFHAIKGRKDNPNAAVPIIALTANAILGAKKDYLEAGFTDYLSKPVDGETLEKMIMKYLPEGMYTIQY